tara:strand:+ start:144 stop:1049 length:906 start_codon:yes stop_codon:yes gene_type:complete
MKKSYILDYKSNGMRLDRWVKNNLGKVPQSLIEKNLRKGKIKVNKKKTKSSYKLKINDKIDFFDYNFKEKIYKKKIKYNPSKGLVKENENLIIDNNNDFIVLNKSAGISVQGGTKSKKNLIDIFAKSKYFQDSKPYSVHRLDKDTSGVYIIAKNRETAQLLTSLFRLRKIHKTYLAICYGEINENYGELNNNLIRYDLDKKIVEKAITKFKVLDKNSNSSFISMQPITGRKHQLRKQLSLMNHPIFGDKKYNYNFIKKNSSLQLMLHAYEIKFMIKNEKFTYRALPPDYFKKFLKTKRLSF